MRWRSFLFVSTAATLFLVWVADGARRPGIDLSRASSSSACSVLVHAFHLEDYLKGSMEHLVQTFLLLCRAHDEALESIFLRSLLYFFI